ncbi:hypothetical protein QE152_g30117 [Popillia japonica]|uniref:Uncharacterized protein n=1 Tax=Popillia japonica TaxID=7064 RepID=A0AAW1JFY6_POPJA
MFDLYRCGRIDDYNNFKRFYRHKLEDSKRSFNHSLPRNSNNKSKTIWKIIRGETTWDNSSDFSIYCKHVYTTGNKSSGVAEIGEWNEDIVINRLGENLTAIMMLQISATT